MRIRCKQCGWRGEKRELLSKTTYEDYGDVVWSQCPNCKAIDYECYGLFDELQTRVVKPATQGGVQ